MKSTGKVKKIVAAGFVAKTPSFHCSWSRLGLRVSPAETKADFLAALERALAAGCRLGQDFVAGINSVSRLLERGELLVLCIAREASPQLHNHIVEAVQARRVPVVIFPKLGDELSKALKIKSASCFGIPTRFDAKIEQGGEEDALLLREGARDALSELLATLASDFTSPK